MARRWRVTEQSTGDDNSGAIVGPFVKRTWYAHAWAKSANGGTGEFTRYTFSSEAAAKRAVERWLAAGVQPITRRPR